MRRTVVLVGLALWASSCSDPSRADQFSGQLAGDLAEDPGSGLDPAVAECVAEAVTTEIAEQLESVEHPVEDLIAGSFAAGDLDMDAATAVDLLDDCDVRYGQVDLRADEGLAGDLLGRAATHAYTRAVGLIDPAAAFTGDALIDAACVASAVVTAVGVDVLADLGEPDDLAQEPSLLAAGLRYDPDIAGLFSTELESCGADRSAVLRSALAPALFEARESLYECAAENLDQDGQDQIILASALANSDAFTIPEAQRAVTSSLEQCAPEVAADATFTRALLEVLVTDPARPLPAHEGACIDQQFTPTLGAGRAASLAASAAQPADALNLLRFTPDEASSFAHAVGLCTFPFEVLVVVLPLETLSEDQHTCLAGLLGDPDVSLDAISQLTTGTTPGEIPAITAALDSCGLPR